MSARRLAAVAALAVLPLATAGAQVQFERAGFRLTSIGERISVSGRVVDASRRPVATTSIRWRVADPSIASVSPQGVVVSKKVGNTKLWAVAGEDSASALILVDQWAAKFDFLPASVRLDAVGAIQPLRIVVRDKEGHPIASQNRRPASCRSINENVASLSANGEVAAKNIGVTWVRCSDRGIADSVRIEVRQRPVRVTIADKASMVSRAVGDTIRLRVTAADARGGDIRNVAATFASLNPTIVSVDPVSGLARLVGLGTARVVAQAGDVTDTVSVGVAQVAGGAVPTNAEAAVDNAAARGPSVKIDALYPIVGDTTALRWTVRDGANIEIQGATVTFEVDTSMVRLLSRGRFIAKKEGQSFVLARFGESVDSALIYARNRQAVTVSATTAEAARAFVRPTFNVDSLMRTYQNSRDSARASIFDSSRVRGLKAPWFLVSATVLGGPAAHSFRDSTGAERRTGFMYGGQADVSLFRYLKLIGEFRTGTLNSSAGTGTELGVTEATGTLAAQANEAFALGGSYTLRATREGSSSTPLAIQQWRYPRVFVSLRPAFIGGAVRTNMTINALLPGATYTGYVDATGEPIDPEAMSLGGEAGLDVLVRGGWRLGLTYNVESFRFPKVGTGEPRRDQFSTIRLKAGWQFAK
jgi:hypothetical protein